ncbi:MAG: DUF3224 domain-containing protein, partial [Variovorax sp.]
MMAPCSTRSWTWCPCALPTRCSRRWRPGSLKERTMTMISGEFSVDMTPWEADDAAPAVARMRLDKHYRGDLTAQGAGLMLATQGGVAGSAAYVAMETVTGTLQGREGSFALVHRGVMERGAPTLLVSVVP